jgi:hypothetical protein
MGMTTKRIIEIFNDYDRISGIILRGNSEEETKFNCETIEASQSINVILHKYQQIEQILDDCDLEAWEILEKVKDVVRGKV